ncbi:MULTISPECIES: acetolactate synthase 2 catalytic subunit [unclassified Gilliamella]|uniref:acetolactate synthase 2 catalytic subunit n=1 Tax=unclassified Gilliamella TaxID=2685620 RepID=UPI002269B03B|nr:MULTISPECIES: acetolactate synthase 2 catalytic subunit [unclassified Gilliamella]MCX8641976.1 acetolactate synthase 2 catalytic subunit [Gilliamella sp. B3835]MCX8706897.1 acetolactate synthase 2 catalytic subunit [Gilliamella sp. B3783]MCX8708756.1 acetolactate synthase 2 catalytic subunit [Gilliamella sp. B3780]MCX8710961.1 acetolactate synthase 2 catalytic subunit [Gilliamella sp. B3468]MCX8713539.1 acetolactate synthase 2 catalytic subunit [Gilliamella sp. B3781]
MLGTQWIVKTLKEKGVTTVFGYPGGQIMPLYDALYDGGIEHVLCRHEQGAAMAAIGYARATGKIGVCIATSGPGATNIITGLADALIDSVPIVAITGQVPNKLIGTDAFQEVDVLGLSLACTKHSYLIDQAENLPNILEEAFYLANSGRPGPILIDVPKDIQLADLNYQKYLSPITTHPNLNNTSKSNISPADIELAKTMISQAKKPMLYIGGGVGLSGAIDELRQFMNFTQIPSVSTLKGLGAADINNPYYLGLIGMHGSKAANLAVQECDLLIALGVRFDDRVTGNLNEFARHAKVIHIDIDQAEINKLKQTHLGLQGDIKSVLPSIHQAVAIGDWHNKIQELKNLYPTRYDHPGDPIYAPALLKTLSERKSPTTIVTTDVGQHQMWTAQHMQFNDPKNFITSSGLGTMGFGLPAAIGAQLARPNDSVICISGDGSIMMNIQELTTIKRKKLPIKIVLIDNQRLGMVRQWQELFFNQRYSETNLSDNPDFLMLAKAFDITGEKITKKSEIEPAITNMLNSPNAYLLHVCIDELENVWPLVPPGASNENMLDKKGNNK